MKGCKVCDTVEPLNEHFDAIFDFLEENDLGNRLFDSLTSIRMGIHMALDIAQQS